MKVKKDLTPKEIAIRISFIVALVSALIVYVSLYFISEVNYFVIFLVFVFSLLAAYVSFILAIEQFIYKKIKLIYRTIHHLKLKKSDDTNDLDLGDDILSQVKSEVIDWSRESEREITRLKELENYRRQFVGNVAHELKTPIFNIQGYLLTLLEGGLNDPNINEEYLERANDSVDRMISIIEDLDEITRLESGIIEMDMERFNLIDLVLSVKKSLELKAASKNITINVANDGLKPIWVKADYDKISQVFINLIVNSIKYGTEGGETTIKFFDMDKNVLIEIADNGIGIEKEHLPRLFERFYRTDKSRSRDKGGTGLGLAIVKHIVESHKQTINVRSTPGVGSTFSFTLQKSK